MFLAYNELVCDGVISGHGLQEGSKFVVER